MALSCSFWVTIMHHFVVHRFLKQRTTCVRLMDVVRMLHGSGHHSPLHLCLNDYWSKSTDEPNWFAISIILRQAFCLQRELSWCVSWTYNSRYLHWGWYNHPFPVPLQSHCPPYHFSCVFEHLSPPWRTQKWRQEEMQILPSHVLEAFHDYSKHSLLGFTLAQQRWRVFTLPRDSGSSDISQAHTVYPESLRNSRPLKATLGWEQETQAEIKLHVHITHWQWYAVKRGAGSAAIIFVNYITMWCDF